MILCFRRMSFLFSSQYVLTISYMETYHSVSAFGSSMGTAMRWSIGFIFASLILSL